MRLFDGLTNVISRMGTARDKSAHTIRQINGISQGELDKIYRSSGLSQKVIDLPPGEIVRAWRDWQAEPGQIEALEAEEKRLNLKSIYKTAKRAQRLYGGAAILIGAGGDPEEPLNLNSVSRGGLEYITLMTRSDLSPGQIGDDPRQSYFREPMWWQFSTGRGIMRVHPSRVAVFNGIKTPDPARSFDYWGDSILESAETDIRRLEEVLANINALTYEAKVDIMRLKDLSQQLQTRGEDGEKLIMKRTELAALGKGIHGTLVMDSEDEYMQKTASFATLPDIVDRFMLMPSAVSGIPVTKLFGQAPGGLQSTGDADTRNYYDMIDSMRNEDSGAMGNLDETLIRSALGDRPPEVHYTWGNLYQPDAKEKAEIGDKIASMFEKLARNTELPSEALARAVVNSLTEAGVAPGLETAVDQYYSEGELDGG